MTHDYLRVFRFSSLSIIAPIFRYHLYLNIPLIRRTSGQDCEPSNKAVLFRVSDSFVDIKSISLWFTLCINVCTYVCGIYTTVKRSRRLEHGKQIINKTCGILRATLAHVTQVYDHWKHEVTGLQAQEKYGYAPLFPVT